MEDQPSRQRLTADKVVAAFQAMDIKTIDSVRAPECQRIILPRSLKLPASNNAEYSRHLQQLVPIFKNFHLIVNDVIEDPKARKIVMHLIAHADTVVGEYNNEYVWFMDFDEEGEKIVAWKEFVDVGVNRDFWPKLQAARNKARGYDKYSEHGKEQEK